MARKYVVPHHQQALVEGGLTPAQASLYECLVQYGTLPASRASFLASVSRTLGYKILGELEGIGLVIKNDQPGKVATFSAVHPFKLKEIADKRFEEAKDAKAALEGTLSKLISDFNTVAGQPGVRILEGIAGIQELFEDQYAEKRSIKLILSSQNGKTPELETLSHKHTEKLGEMDILVQTIAPNVLTLPIQIAIYSNKIALTSYEELIMTTIIENTPIRMALELMFDYISKK
jgi:sugar-specific transcriptional regulator TrmB